MRTLTKVSFVMAVLLATGAMATPVEVELQEGVSGYAGTDDNSLYARSSTSNYGTATSNYITTANNPDARRGLVRFDLSGIPAGSQADGDAKLTVWSNVSGGGSTPEMTVNMYAMTSGSSGWAETDCSWDYIEKSTTTVWPGGSGLSAGTDYAATPISSITAQYGNGWARNFIFSQTDMQAALDQGYLAVVFIGDGNHEDKSMYFRSSEYSIASTRPKLTFSYVPEPTTIGLLSLGGIALLRRRR